MKLFEYQAKEVFVQAGIAVPKALLADSVESVAAAAESIGYPCMLKSQMLMGGRGNKGLIPRVSSQAQARSEAQRLFRGEYSIKKILVEEAVDIQQELYLSVTVDPLAAEGVVICSAEGGVEIEQLAVENPEKILTEPFDMVRGLQSFQVKDLSYRLMPSTEATKQIQKVITALYQIFTSYDAELAEINPLFITASGQVIAGDGKLMIDENSMHRQKRFERTRDYYESDMEFEAAQAGIPYLQFDGDISLMCAGAGLTTTVYDLINYEGGSIANYLEFGGPNYRKAYEAMELCLRNDSKVILVVTFGTIARADVMAEGIVDAALRLKADRPIVTCIRGTGEQEAAQTLKAAGFEPMFDTEEAVRKAVALAKGAGRP